MGVDLCGALAAALSGSINTKRTDLPIGEDHLIAEFPQEWLRDPASPHLRSAPADVPWDDPHLLCAMLAMRNAQLLDQVRFRMGLPNLLLALG